MMALLIRLRDGSANVPLSWKLTVFISGMLVVALATLGVLADQRSRGAVVELVSEQERQRAHLARKAVERFAEDMRNWTATLADTSLGREPLRDFSTQWNTMFGVNPSEDLHRAYIDQNPHPIGQKDALVKADDGSSYSNFHAQYHPGLRTVLKQQDYYDIFLITAEGEIVYSVYKERDFATNLLTGPWKDSGLADLFRQVSETKQAAESRLQRYGPSADAPALFFAAPILDNTGALLGVAAIQANISQLMAEIAEAAGSDSENRSMFIVGEDGLLRSDLTATDTTDEALTLTWASPLLAEAISTGASSGQTTGILGVPVYMAIETLIWGGETWAMVTQIRRDAFLAEADATRLTMVLVAVPLLIVAIILGWIIARAFARPINALAGAVDRLSAGEVVDLPALQRGDEIGQLARALLQINQMAVENGRIRTALDCVAKPTMITDANHKIMYCNGALRTLLSHSADWMRQRMPDFDPDNLVGSSIHAMHRGGGTMAASKLSSMSQPQGLEILLDQIRIALQVTPLTNDAGERTGFMAEWEDVTAQRQIEDEIDQFLNSVSSGEFSQRISTQSDQAFVNNLIAGLNQTSEVMGGFLAELQTTMAAMSGGDMTRRLSEDQRGGFLEVAQATNRTMAKTGELVGQIKTAGTEIQEAVSAISSGAADLSARAEGQASSLEETAATMEQLAASVRSNAENIEEVNKLSAKTSRGAKTGQDVVNNAVHAMARIEESSDKVAEIIKVIDGIAFQTNLLALNAAVEAARAGDAGKGFAVVASEVRSLAQRSADAARDIKELIDASGGEVATGVDLVRSTGDSLTQIVDGIAKVANTASQITMASQEQTNGIEEVAAAVGKMDEVTQQTSGLAEKSAREADRLLKQVDALNQLTGTFKVDETPGIAAPKPSKPTEAELDAAWEKQAEQSNAQTAKAPVPSKVNRSVAPPALASATKASSVSIPDDADWSEF
ncbi:MAG: methyl-accepting chemotaxis protein [Pseudomonadota bacterium]